MTAVVDDAGLGRFRPHTPGAARARLAIAYAFAENAEAALDNGLAAATIVRPEEDVLEGGVRLGNLAMVRLIVGDYDGALTDIERIRAIPHPLSFSTMALRLDPIFDPIRDDPRFARLLQGWPR